MTFRKITSRVLACILVVAAADPCLAAEKPKTTPAASSPAAPSGSKNDRYVIGSGDRINYRVIEDRDESKILVVSPTGELDVPYYGRVELGGKSLDEAAKIIKGLLEKDLYFQATVVMSQETSAAAARAKQISVVGQVKGQGPQDMPIGEKYMLSRAILKAGGIGQFGNGKAVQIIRKKADGSTDRIEVNVDAILKDGDVEKDIELIPEDLVIVKQKWINW